MASTEKIRVLHMIPSFDAYGGVGAVFANLCKYRNEDRFQFDLVLFGDERTKGLERFRNLGCEVYVLPKTKISRPWTIIRNIKRFMKENATRYQILHHHQAGIFAWAWLYFAQKYGIKKRIIHAHTTIPITKCKLFYRLFISPLNNTLATDYCSCGRRAGVAHFGKRPFHWIKNGMDLSRFENVTDEQVESARKEFGITPNDQVVGCVARFDVYKNYDKSVDYFNLAYQKNPNLKALFVGDGKEREKIQRQVEKLGLTDRVVFTGNRSDVPTLLRLMDVFLLPSAFEGFPVAIAEAITSSLRCVISDVIEFPRFEDRVFDVSLEAPKETWADLILDVLRRPKLNDGIKLIRKSGYDAKDSAGDLCKHYDKLLRDIG